MNIKELQKNIDSYLSEEVSISSPLMVDVDRNVFLSDVLLANEFKVDLDVESVVDQLEAEMTSAVGTPQIKYCDDVSIIGKLMFVDDRYCLKEVKELTLIFGPEEKLKVI